MQKLNEFNSSATGVLNIESRLQCVLDLDHHATQSMAQGWQAYYSTNLHNYSKLKDFNLSLYAK